MMFWRNWAGPIGQRIALGVGANALGKLWVAIIQLLSIPVLAGAWGAERFGLWLMIMTVPTYIALTATGFNAVAGVDIARNHVQGRLEDCKSTYQSVWVLISAITGAIVCAGLIVRLLLASTGGEPWRLGASEAADTATLVVIYAFLVIQSSMVLAVYRGASRYAEGTLLFDLIQLAEGLAVIAVASLGGSLFEAAAAMTLIRLAGLMGLHVLIVRREPWARASLTSASASEIHRLLQPSLGALSIAGGNALALQGVVVTVGLALGPAAAAAFASARTVARLPLQLADLVGRAAQPEMARAWFEPDHRLFWRVNRLNVAFAVGLLLPYCVILTLFGGDILKLISGGKLVYEPHLVSMISLVVVFQGLNLALGHTVSAQMRQNAYGHIYIFSGCAAVLLPFAFQQTLLPIKNVALGLLACEIIVSCALLMSILRGSSINPVTSSVREFSEE